MKARKFRWRLLSLILLFVVGCATLGGIYVYRKHQFAAFYANLRTVGLEAAKANDHKRTVEFLEPYLPRHPDDIEVLLTYARSRPLVPAAQNGHLTQTIIALRYLLRIEPDRVAERRDLLNLYIKSGYAAEALDTATVLLEKYEDAHPDSLRGKAQALARLRRFSDALLATQAWVKAAPRDLEAQMQTLWLMAVAKRPAEEMRQVAAAAFTEPPDAARADLVQGYVYVLTATSEQDRVIAQARLQRAAATGPTDDAFFGNALMTQLDALGLQSEAMDLLRRMYKSLRTDDLRNNLAYRLWEMGQPQEVIDLLAGIALSDATTSAGILAIDAISLHALGRNDDALTVVASLQSRKEDAAASAWAQIIGQLTKPNEVDAGRLLAACQTAMAQNPNDAYLRFFTGEAYLRLGEGELAVRMWSEAANRNRSWPVPLMRAAETLRDMGRLESAFETATAAAARGGRIAAHVLRLRIWLRCLEGGLLQGTEDELLALLDQVERNLGTLPPELAVVRGVLFCRMERKDEARMTMAGLLARPEPLPKPLLLEIAAQSGRFELGLEDQCFDRCARDYGMSPELAFAAAARQFALGSKEEGQKRFEAARAGVAGAGDDFQWEWHRGLYLRLVGDPRAREVFVKLADARPDNIHYQKLALTGTATQEDAAFRGRVVERLRKLTGEQSLGWRLAKAKLLLDLHQEGPLPEQAVSLLSEVVRRSPDLAEARLMLGSAYARAGNSAEATEHLRVARDLNPKLATLGLDLAKLYQDRGEFRKAKEELDRILASPFPGAKDRRQTAVLLAAQGESAPAIELLEQTVAGDADATLMLAYLYRQTNQLGRADEVLQGLLSHEPTVRAVLFAAELFAQQGRKQDAELALKKLDEMQLDAGMRELAKAEHFARHDKMEEGIKLLRGVASTTARGNPAVWRALAGYEVAAGRVDEAIAAMDAGIAANPADDGLLAMRRQASLLQQSQAFPSLRTFAVAFVANPATAKGAAEALRVGVAGFSSKQSPEQIAASMENVGKRFPRFVHLQLWLTHWYLDIGDLERAVAAARRAVQIAPNMAEPYRLLVMAMGKTGQIAERLEFARRWRDRTQGNALPADLAIAETLTALNRAAEARETIEPYMKDSTSELYPEVIRVFSKAEDEAGREGISRLFEPLLKQGARGRIAWMSYALTTLTPSEAAGWLRRAAAEIPADAHEEQAALAEAWGNLALRANDPRYVQEARTILEPLAAKPDANETILIVAANRREQDGDVAGAMSFYRRIIEGTRSPVAQNNLAMLLARNEGDMQEAQVLIDAAIETAPTLAPLHDTKAFVLAKAGHVDGALDSIRVAIQFAPGNAQYRIHFAELLKQAGQRSEAREAVAEIDRMVLSLRSLPEAARQRLDRLRGELADPSAATPVRG